MGVATTTASAAPAASTDSSAGTPCSAVISGQALAVHVVGSDATDPFHPCEDANVMATEVAGSDDCSGDFDVCHEAQDNTVAAGVQFSGGSDRTKGVNMLDVKKLLLDVFDPQPGETVTFVGRSAPGRRAGSRRMVGATGDGGKVARRDG